MFDTIQNQPIQDYLEDSVESSFYYDNRFKIYDEIRKNITKHINTNTIYQYRRYYVRENKSNVCPTLTANMGTGGHNIPLIMDDDGIRKLTPRECFNLQGFDNNFKLPNLSNSKLYKLAGNSISVPVVQKIISKLNNLLDEL